MKYRNIFLLFIALFSFACAQAGGFSVLDQGQPDASANAGTPGKVATDSPPTVSPNANCGLGDIRKDVLRQVNAFRAAARYCGKEYFPATSPIRWNSELEKASALHSLDMATKNYFDHDSLNGDSFSDRIRDAGYTWASVGENISAGRSTVSTAIQSWIKSPGHCANIMTKTFSELGVACAHDSKSKYKYFWTMDLGKPRFQ